MIDITWSFLNPVIRKSKGHKPISADDVTQSKYDFGGKKLATEFATQFNSHPERSIIKHLFVANRKYFTLMLLGVPFMVLAQAIQPLCIRQFQTQLQAANMFDCFSEDPTNFSIKQKTLNSGLNWVFTTLYPYWILIAVGQLLRSASDSWCASNALLMGVRMTSALLDSLFNKMMVLSETTKNVNAQGSLANILFTDTFKIQLFMKLFYFMLVIPLEVVVSIIYLGVYIDPRSLLGVCSLFVFVPIILLCGATLQKNLSRMATMRDARSQKIQEILNAIKVVKLFNTESFQEKRIDNVRQEELRYVRRAAAGFSGQLTIGNGSFVVMSVIAIGSLIGFKRFDITKVFTMIHLFTFIEVSMGFFPAVLMAASDGVIAIKRIGAFLHLPEIDRSIIDMEADIPDAIQIHDKHSFAYGLDEDQKVASELDSAYYLKLDRLREMHQNIGVLRKIFSKIYVQRPAPATTVVVAAEAAEMTVADMIAAQSFDLSNSMCVSLCTKFNLPAVSYFMSLKNYLPTYFEAQRGESRIELLERQYLHMCVIVYNLNEWENMNQKKEIVPVIKELDLTVPRGQLIGIEGPVGSGKTSLFSCILGEMKAIDLPTTAQGIAHLCYDYFGETTTTVNDNAFIKLNGRVAFCPQNSPIFSSTIRENIIFYKEYDEQRYNKIVDICCLLPDFDIFPARDLTEVGGRGVTLSGGQRARISLARALYNDADIYLLDDPLSAVDAHVGRRIWNEAILDYLVSKGKTVLIASHQTHYFKTCNRIIRIEEGKIVSDIIQSVVKDEISSSAAANTTPSVLKLENQHNAVAQAEITEAKDSTVGKLTKEETLTGSGNVKASTYTRYIKSGGTGIFVVFLVMVVLYQVLTQFGTVSISYWMSDKYGWTTEEFQQSNAFESVLQPFYDEFGNHIYVTQAVMQCYAQATGTPSIVPNVSTNYFYIYLGCGLVGFAVLYFMINLFFVFSTKAARRIYQWSVGGVIRTKLAFFDVTPQGRIINRLVKDTESVDFVFSRFFQIMVLHGSTVIGMILTCCITTWPCIIVIVPCVIVYLILFSLFRAITPQLKRLESNTRSKVFNICQEVLDQLVSIRAYQVQSNFRSRFRELADDNINKQWFANSISKWLNFRMTMVGAVMAILIVGAAMIITPFSPAIAQYSGIIVSYGFGIQSLLAGFVEMITNAESEMPSIERMLEYSDLESEQDLDEQMRKENESKLSASKQDTSAQEGLLIRNIKMRYRPELPCALNGVDLHVKPGEHVAIVGRTGSGKSSLAITLFKLYQPETGYQILLDGERLEAMDLYDARRRLAIILQEPYLFSGTLRQQLCEYTRCLSEGLSTTGLERVPDIKLWELLDIVQMSEYVKQQPGGLDCLVIGNGENFSSGQRQLICVVRALLRNAKVVLLDEATAYIDRETDKIIQEIVKNYLRDVIVLSIAHRLDTVLDMDKVLVMDAGRVAEYGTKEELVEMPNGIFRSLVNQAGIIIETRGAKTVE